MREEGEEHHHPLHSYYFTETEGKEETRQDTRHTEGDITFLFGKRKSGNFHLSSIMLSTSPYYIKCIITLLTLKLSGAIGESTPDKVSSRLEIHVSMIVDFHCRRSCFYPVFLQQQQSAVDIVRRYY